MPKGIPNKRYTPEFKKLVVETMQEEKLSYSETCRRFEVNSRDQINPGNAYEYTCAHCGKPFTAYGNKGRKYCSHECYIADRFGEERGCCD